MEPPIDPTPAEIRAACELIQQTWSDDERERRCWGMQPGNRHAHSGEPISPFTVPTVSIDVELAGMMNVAG